MSDSSIYACHRCGAVEVKLWRLAQSFYPETKCVDCLAMHLLGTAWEFEVGTIAEDGSRAHPTRGNQTDQIGWWLPAVQVMEEGEDRLMYWGYTSSSPEDYQRWVALPLRMTEDA